MKLSLKPFYNKKTIGKDDYKEIMRKCVQKVSFKCDFMGHIVFDVGKTRFHLGTLTTYMYYIWNSILIAVHDIIFNFLFTGVPQQIRRDKPYKNSGSSSRLHQEGQVLPEEADRCGRPLTDQAFSHRAFGTYFYPHPQGQQAPNTNKE